MYIYIYIHVRRVDARKLPTPKPPSRIPTKLQTLNRQTIKLPNPQAADRNELPDPKAPNCNKIPNPKPPNRNQVRRARGRRPGRGGVLQGYLGGSVWGECVALAGGDDGGAGRGGAGECGAETGTRALRIPTDLPTYLPTYLPTCLPT